MQAPRRGEITKLLDAWREGEREAEERLMDRLYQELRNLAAAAAARLRGVASWQAGDLLHESFLHLRKQRRVQWQNRDHFFSVAARVMNRTLVDAWRQRSRKKRGGGAEELPLEELAAIKGPETDGPEIERLAFDQALSRLVDIDPVAARTVKLLAVDGFSYDEAAKLMGVGRATVSRSWRFGRSFLRTQLTGKGGPPGGLILLDAICRVSKK